ncbi:hypothetical protein [Sphingomonas sp. LK11]|uniref:hypothetical protein n=1 Tax=Sphingomonas sp. LK11 TaxID=1390395 RepID=UPI0012EB8E3E|nr:hypothetical protein [Sphingomonas sp. LK11]
MATEFPESLRERAALYANAMHEVRMRLRMLKDLQKTKLPQLFVYESCQLQLRLVCECFAVACLAAQGDFKTHKAFRERYEPGAIFKALEEHYPDFFPSPATLINVNDTWHFNAKDDRPEAITRGDIESVWNRSGGHLHRASAKRYVARTNQVDFVEVNNRHDALWSLLYNHAIILAPAIENVHATLFHVLMDPASDTMKLHFLHINNEDRTIAIEELSVATA